MLTAEHLLGFGGIDLLIELVQRFLKIRGDVLAALRPFEQHADVVDLFREAIAELEIFRQAALPLKGLLCFGLVVPETGRGDFLLELR